MAGAKVALPAIKGQQPVNEIATIRRVYPSRTLQWNRQAVEVLLYVFSIRRACAAQDDKVVQAPLYQQMG